MKLAFHLAYKNLINSGLRTWLNVAVLSFVFIVILFYKGMLEGWNLDAERQNIAWEYAQGQVVHPEFESHNPLTFSESHGKLESAEQKGLVPVLLRPASIFPNGRQVSVNLRGIPENQEIVAIPTKSFDQGGDLIPAIIGKRLAQSAKLAEGDQFMVRWRDKNGSYDAGNLEIVNVFDSDVPTIDQGQLWLPIEDLRSMTGLQGEATYYLVGENFEPSNLSGWTFKSLDVLLKDLREMMEIEESSAAIIYSILLAIALIAIFDTQVLSIFRRQKEIGSYVALGMTRQRVMVLFTLEGAMYSMFSVVVGLILGIPIMAYFQSVGIAFGDFSDSTGITIGDRIYPVYSLSLLVDTALIIIISSTLVSLLPAGKIAKMNPVLALKGKLQ